MKTRLVWVGLIFLCLEYRLLPAQAADHPSTPNSSRKVEVLIDKIESAPPLKKGQPLRMERVREEDLNAYITRRILQVKDPMLSDLKIHPQDNNRVKGSFTLDFSGMDIPVFISTYMPFHFSGRIETNHGKGRFLLSELRLNNEPVTVEFLDTVLTLMASLNGYEPKGVQDWYALPHRISGVRTLSGYAEITY